MLQQPQIWSRPLPPLVQGAVNRRSSEATKVTENTAPLGWGENSDENTEVLSEHCPDPSASEAIVNTTKDVECSAGFCLKTMQRRATPASRQEGPAQLEETIPLQNKVGHT